MKHFLVLGSTREITLTCLVTLIKCKRLVISVSLCFDKPSNLNLFAFLKESLPRTKEANN